MVSQFSTHLSIQKAHLEPLSTIKYDLEYYTSLSFTNILLLEPLMQTKK